MSATEILAERQKRREALHAVQTQQHQAELLAELQRRKAARTAPIVELPPPPPPPANGSKLTEAEVIQIRERYAAGGVSTRQLGKEFQLQANNISKIVRGGSYKDFGGPRTFGKKCMSKLSADQAKEIRRRYTAEGITQHQLAEQYGVSRGVISKVVAGRSFKGI